MKTLSFHFPLSYGTWHSIPLSIINLTCLTIGEYAGIVSLESVIQYIASQSVKHILLAGKVGQPWVQRVETVIKCKGFGRFSETDGISHNYIHNIQGVQKLKDTHLLKGTFMLRLEWYFFFSRYKQESANAFNLDNRSSELLKN